MKTPYEFQFEAIEAAAEQQKLFLLDEPGLGKTLQGIEATRYAPPGPRFVTTPKNNKMFWHDEIIGQFPDATVYVSTSGGYFPPDFKWSLVQDRTWVVVHPQDFLRIGRELVHVRWGAAILDEAHRFKNRKAKQTIWARMLKAGMRIAMTATPMEHDPSDMWTTLSWINDMGKPTTAESPLWRSYWAFRKRFVEVETHPYFGYPQVKGPKDPDVLAGIIGPYTFKRDKSFLPPLTYSRIPVGLEGEQKKLYDQLSSAKDIEVRVGNQQLIIRNTLAHIVRLQQLSSDPTILGYRTLSTKIEWIRDYVLDNPDEPIVVFTKFRSTAIHLGGLLKAIVVVGGMRNPTMVMADWLTGKKNILVGTIKSIGESINDLKRARTSIFLDQEWSAGIMTQAEHRIHRVDDPHNKHIIYLYTRGTVDELVIKALDEKWDDAAMVYHYLQAFG